VATCPELSSDFTCDSEKQDGLLKLLPGHLESRTDSAPSVLPVPQSVPTHHLSVSHSASDVGIPLSTSADTHTHCVADVSTPHVNVTDQKSRGVADVGECDTCATAASEVVNNEPPHPSDTVTCLSHITEATDQLTQTEATSQTVASVDAVTICTSTPDTSSNVAVAICTSTPDTSSNVAVAICTSTPDTSSNVVACGLVSEAVDSADLPAEMSFVYHEGNACDHMMSTSSVTSAPGEFDGGATSKPSVGNSEHTDKVPCTSLSSETVINSAEMLNSGRRRLLAVLGPSADMPYVDESAEVSDAEMSDTLCASEAAIVTSPDDGSSLSAVAAGSEACEPSAAVDDVSETMMSFCSEVAECGSNNENDFSLNDTRLVS